MNHVLRVVRVVTSLCPAYLRPLIIGLQEVLNDVKELVQVAAGAVLHDNRNTVRRRVTLHHRRCEGQNGSILDVGGLHKQLSLEARHGIGIEEEAVDTVALPQSADFPPQSVLALRKGFQLDDKRGLVASRTGDEVVTLQLLAALYGGEGGNNRIYLIDNLLGACHGGCRWHGNGTEHNALVFIGHKTGLRRKHGDAQHDNTQNDRSDNGDGLTHQFLYRILIFRVHGVE